MTKLLNFVDKFFYQRQKKLILSLLLFSVSASTLWGQHQISGTVLEKKTNTPVIGATVTIQKTTEGVLTDVDGHFLLETDLDFPITLKVSYIGFNIQEVDVYSAEEPIIITLTEDIHLLNEVVVIGYTQTRNNARTSAVSTIKSEDIRQITASGFTEQIQGQSPGLLVSTTSGTPGSNVFVRLRGTTSINAGNDPLYVVDGIPINSKPLQSIAIGGQTTNPLSDLNPADIENILILKDANATAIYGARGANGVILITTKRGDKVNKTIVSLNAEYGFAKAAKLWELTTGPEHAQILNEAWVNDGNDPLAIPYRSKESGGLGTPEEQNTYDRQSLVFRTAALQNYNVSVTGNDSKTNFYIGAEYAGQEAIVKTQDFNRLAFRVNLDHKISEKVSVGTSNSLSRTARSLSRTANSPKGILQASVHTATLLPIYKEDGSYAKYGIFDNVNALIAHNDHNAVGLRTINNVYLKWNITHQLTFKSSASTDLNNYQEKRYFNTELADGQPNGNATDATTKDQTYTLEQLLNYVASIQDKHTLTAFLGNSLQRTKWEQESINASGFPSDQFKRLSSAAVTSAVTNGSANGLISYFGGANFSFDNRYSVDANLRADASSRFGEEHRWGYFPSFGLSWSLSEEKFLKGRASFLSHLKLKASLGWTGNQNIDDFASLGLWSGGGNYGDAPGISHTRLANPDLKWETTRQWNLGLETSLLENRLALELNYYNKYTTDLLLNVPVPAKSGFSSTISNVGEMSNKGIELEITSTNVRTKDFLWTSAFNIAHNKNLIEKLPVSFSQYSRDWVRLEEGYPMYSFWLYKQLYVDTETGNAVYDDSRTNDGRITTDDRQIVGDAWPDFTGGLRNNLTYKQFDLSVLLYFSVGNDVFNMNRFFQEHGGVRGTNWSLLDSQLDRWQKPGDITSVPRASTVANPDGSKNNDFQSSRFLEDGSFLRLRNVSLGYTVPEHVLKPTGIAKLRLYVNATNLLTWTGYSGADPEGNTAADQTGGTVQGLDFAIPPQPRQVVFGVNVTF